MSRALLSTLIAILVIIGLATLHGDLIALAIPLLAALCFGLAEATPAIQLQATRSITPDRVAQGQPVEVLLQVVNQGPALYELHLQDRLPSGLTLLSGTLEQRAALATGATLELRYQVTAARGMYRFQEVQGTIADRLGIFPEQIQIAAPGSLFVMPRLMRLQRINVRPRRTRIYAGQIPARQGGAGIEFFGLREYQPGDQLRHVNARASARIEQKLFVNEYEQERVADVGIVLDARARADVAGLHGSLFEHGVEAAAAIADTLLAQGNRVGLLIYGNAIEWTFPGYGKIQREKVMRALAAARVADRLALESLDLIPVRLFPPQSLLILISSLVDDDIRPLERLRARGYQLAIISPNAARFERNQLKNLAGADLALRIANIERTLLLRRLAQIGIAAVSWDVEQPLEAAVTHALAQVRYQVR